MNRPAPPNPSPDAPPGHDRSREVALIDLLDRALSKGVVVSGEVVISVADVDLIYLGLKVLLTSVERAEALRQAPADRHAQPD